jgi:hypothetical protein
MSITRKTARYAAVAVGLGVLIVLASVFYLGTGTTGQSQASSQSHSNSVYGSLVLVQLTDPPTVPVGTTSLNLTYSSVGILVAEPTQGNQVTTSTVTVSPQGGSATVDLLKLQNVSQTVASASLPSGSTIYSVTFGVTSISMEVNGTSYPVTLATGTSSLTVTLLRGSVLQGTNAALLELNPTVVNTSTGYQMIPTSVGIMRPQSEVNSQGVGSQQDVTNQDNNDLNDAQGQVAARLVTLSTAGNVTTITVQVNNTGSTPISLVALSLQGNFSAQMSCTTTSTTDHGDSHDQGQGQTNGGCGERGAGEHNQLVFVPIASTTTSTSSTTSSATTTASSSSSAITSSSSSNTSSACGTGQMTTAYGDGGDHNPQLTLSPGECIDLSFTGTTTIGNSMTVVTPSTSSGQTYTLHVIATNNAEAMLSCVLPLTSASCTSNGGHDN